jgi:ABC-type transporter Mla subunit MlaD
MAKGSYDTDAMRRAAADLDAAAGALSGLARHLTALPAGAVPGAVHDALDHLGRRGRDLIADVVEETTALADGLGQAAQCYDDLEHSLIRQFAGG